MHIKKRAAVLMSMFVFDRVTVSNWRTSLWKSTGASWTACVLALSLSASLNCSKYLFTLVTAAVSGL